MEKKLDTALAKISVYSILVIALLSFHCCLYIVVKCVGYYTIHHIVFTHAKFCVVCYSKKLHRLPETNYGRSINSNSLKIRIIVFGFILISVGENS